MKNKIYPCLWFDGQAKAAADLYCSLFKNAKITVDSPMVVNFELNGQKFMGLNGGPHFVPNPSVSFFIRCKTADEAQAFWDALSPDGMVLLPFNTYPWSEKYGWIQDRFGISWQISVDNLPGEQQIVPSMLFTEGVHGRGGEAIDFYTSLFPNSQINVKVPYDIGESTYATTDMFKYSNFTLDGQFFTIMDAGFPQTFTFNEGISFVVDCDGQEEVDYYWNKMTADGGQESQCAWLKDKFGVSWQIVPRQLMQLMNDPNTDKAQNVMQAILKMRKIVIADLVTAYNEA
ncbi:MAG: VOC family protein [Saprospiraceae bacterium]|nr:VOC family protein [Saprospiraceae bacterium]